MHKLNLVYTAQITNLPPRATICRCTTSSVPGPSQQEQLPQKRTLKGETEKQSHIYCIMHVQNYTGTGVLVFFLYVMQY